MQSITKHHVLLGQGRGTETVETFGQSIVVTYGTVVAGLSLTHTRAEAIALRDALDQAIRATAPQPSFERSAAA